MMRSSLLRLSLDRNCMSGCYVGYTALLNFDIVRPTKLGQSQALRSTSRIIRTSELLQCHLSCKHISPSIKRHRISVGNVLANNNSKWVQTPYSVSVQVHEWLKGAAHWYGDSKEAVLSILNLEHEYG